LAPVSDALTGAINAEIVAVRVFEIMRRLKESGFDA